MHRRRSIARRRALWPLFALVLLALLLTGPAALGGLWPSGSTARAGGLRPSEGAAGTVALDQPALNCTALLSSATINSSLAFLYASYASSNGSGGNGSSSGAPPNLPSLAVAQTIVNGWWGSVCPSPTFDDLIASWGASNFTWTVNTTTAAWLFSVGWVADCQPTGYGPLQGCQISDAWTGELTTGALTGPDETARLPCATAHCPTVTLHPPTAARGSGPTSSILPSSGELGWALLGGLGGAAIGLAAALSTRRGPRRTRGAETDSSRTTTEGAPESGGGGGTTESDASEPLGDAF